MRALRIVAVSLVVVALVAVTAVVVAVHYRNAIAARIAAEVLKPYPVAVEEVAVNSIGADRVDLDAVLVLSDAGGHIVVEGLNLPLAAGGLAGLEVTVNRVTIRTPVREPDRAAAVDVVGALDRVVPLPELLPDARISVSRLRVNEYPEVVGLVWESTAVQQTLEASIEEYRIEADLSTADAERSSGRLSVAVDGEPDAAEATLTLVRNPGGYAIDGPFELVAGPLLPVFVRSGLVPATLVRLEAALDGAVSITASEDGELALRASAAPAPGEAAELGYRSADGTTATVRALEASATEVEFAYPSLEWQTATVAARLLLDFGDVRNLGLGLHDVSCRRGIRCTMRVDVEPITLGSGIGIAGRADDVAVSIEAGGWLAQVGEALVEVDGIAGPADLEAALSIRPRSVTLDGAETIRGEFSIPAADVSLLGHGLAVPAANGTFARDGDDLRLTLKLGEPGDAVAADVSVGHDLRTAETRLTLDDARLDFSVRALSGLVEGWRSDWDLVAGAWTGSAEFLRRRDGNVTVSTAQSLDAIAGRYRDIAFAGLSTTLSVADAAWPLPEPQSILLSLDLVDVGFPMRDLEAALSIDPVARRIDVERARIDALGGRLAVDPFVLDPELESFGVTLRPASVQLPLIAELANLAALEVTGSVSGVLPVRVGADGVTIEGGRLSGDPPGGTIRYDAGGCTDEVMRARSGLEFARCVMTHYEFDSLSSSVSYRGDGNLTIEMRLTGVNPEYDPEQPVNLNPTLTTNVADLVRSLQAARLIEEAFDRRAQE